MRSAYIFNFLIEANIMACIAILLMIPLRKFFRKHGPLDLLSGVKFCSAAFAFGSDAGQVIRIVDDTGLHGPDLPIKITDLIVGPDGQPGHILFRQFTIMFCECGCCL